MKALICGISGQDGTYLAQFLLSKGYEVYGTSRDAELCGFNNLKSLEIFDQVSCKSMTLTDFRSVLQVVSEVQPDEIYNLAGQSSVGLSFDQPLETLESIAIGTLNLLEVLRHLGGDIRLYNASSGECYGQRDESSPAKETSVLRPSSPYGVSKCAGYWLVNNYRQAYDLFACSGMLFNHESPLRPERFVTQKIVRAACRIANGSSEQLKLGNLDIIRDWGYAPEYVKAMWLMLQKDKADDFIIATGQSHSLGYFTERAFFQCGLDWKDHVVSDPRLLRASDISHSYADASKAKTELGWEAKIHLDDLIQILIENVSLKTPQ